jgi:hypothetical protein
MVLYKLSVFRSSRIFNMAARANAESINNIMKLDANWKSHSTPALINLLADMIKQFT